MLATSRSEDAGAPSTTATGLTVLVAEDNEADAYLISRALADIPSVGKVVCVRDGVEALALIERGDFVPDLALIDLQMPRMDGFDLLFALASRRGPVFPMVVLTSSAAPRDAVRSRLRTAVRVVTKPDTLTELYAVLKTAIEAVCPRPAAGQAVHGRNPAAYALASPPHGLRRA